jgi:SAM-dependent methyltransferase
MLIPARRRGFEHLDDPALPAAIAERLLRDVALANALFGGARAVLAEVRTVFEEARTAGVRELSLLDVGTGLADIPVAIAALGAEFGIRVTSIGLEHSVGMAQVARKRVATAVAADGRALPFGNDTVDIITCSLVLHHFEGDAALALLRECARVSRRSVIISDLRRSWAAIALLWLVSFPLRFHPFSRHDGVASIRRGFTPAELDATVRLAGARAPRTRTRLGWRVTAAWEPGIIPS